MTDRDRSVRGWNRRNEADAAALVCSYLGGTSRKVDPGGGKHQLHDYDIVMPDGRTLAIEVTQHVDAAETRTLSEIQKRDWTTDILTRNWSVGHLGSLNVTNLHRDLPGLLRELEVLGRTSWISTTRSPVPSDPVLGRLHRLCVRAAQVTTDEPDGGGEIRLTRSSIGHWFDAIDVVDAIEAEANDSGNARKLRSAAGADVRALFVWAGDFADAVSAAMSYGELPKAPPKLPVGVTEAWIATAAEPAKVWRYTSASGWVKLADYKPAHR